jgi:hypothetical protein
MPIKVPRAPSHPKRAFAEQGGGGMSDAISYLGRELTRGHRAARRILCPGPFTSGEPE